MCGANLTLRFPQQKPSQKRSMGWQHHDVGMLFSVGTVHLGKIEEEIKVAIYKEQLQNNMLESSIDLKLGIQVTFQQDNNPKHNI